MTEYGYHRILVRLLNVARRIRTNKTSTFKPPESQGSQIAADSSAPVFLSAVSKAIGFGIDSAANVGLSLARRPKLNNPNLKRGTLY